MKSLILTFLITLPLGTAFARPVLKCRKEAQTLLSTQLHREVYVRLLLDLSAPASIPPKTDHIAIFEVNDPADAVYQALIFKVSESCLFHLGPIKKIY